MEQAEEAAAEAETQCLGTLGLEMETGIVQRQLAQRIAQMFELGGVFMLQTVVVFSVFGVAAGMIGAYLKRRPKVGVWLDRLAGATFIGLGIRVALKD